MQRMPCSQENFQENHFSDAARALMALLQQALTATMEGDHFKT